MSQTLRKLLRMRSNERTEEPIFRTDSLLRSSYSAEHSIQGQNADPERLPRNSVEPHPHAKEPLATDQEYQKNKNAPSIWKLFCKVFIWEILAMILSTGLLLAIVVILNNYNHHPQPIWEYVSLNSIISWISTIAKACVLFSLSEGLGQLKWIWFTQKRRPMSDLRTFDSASRGIYGCAELIWNLRARHFAVPGSLAVILALAFDPFTQNLIHYYPKLVADSTQTAIVPTSSDYDAVGPVTGASNLIESGMKANVYNAIFNSDSSKPWSIPRYSCSSGNCTWDPIATLAMGSSCTNITEMLEYNCTVITDDSVSYLKGLTNCSSQLPDSSLAVYQIKSAGISTSGVLGASGPFFYKNSSITPIQIIAPDPDEDAKWQAFECALHPVVRSFRATVSEGVYQEKTLDVWQNGTYLKNGTLGSEYLLNPPWGSDMGMERNKTFMVSKLSMDTIGLFIAKIFAGRIEQNELGVVINPNTNSIYASGDMIQAVLSSSSNITGCTVESAAKLRCAVENMAAAMSKSFRDTALSTQENSNITGKAMTSKTYITIHWQWIALPAVVWLLGLFTLVGVIWKTRTTIAPTWKNDVIPLLSVYENGPNEKPGTDQQLADKQKLRLFESEGRLRLGN
ncbi:unnamed protein product [Penicillium glandicola]